MPARVSQDHTAFARRLRRDMTVAEVILWRELRDRRFRGAKFRRQVPIGRYVVDFLCVELRFIAELDGPPHETPEQRMYDQARDAWLRGHGYRVLRLQNDIVIGEVDRAADLIREAMFGPQER
jgi:very-short-patch-repair endonuclease